MTSLRLGFFGAVSLLITQLPAYAEIEVADPESVGMSTERLERVAPALERFIDEDKMAGFISLVARRGKVVHFEIRGERDLFNGIPMEEDTIFRIYSMTKPITSVAAMMLYEEGKLLLSDPVAKFIPEFATTEVFKRTEGNALITEEPRRPMQVRDLLNHTSGLIYGSLTGTADDPVERAYSQNNPFRPGSNLESFAARAATLPLTAHPGTEWNYGISTDILGRVVEVASGQPLDLFFRERIFGPLGMEDTSFRLEERNQARFAVNYALDKEGLIAPVPEPHQWAQWRPSPDPFFSGGGGLISTAEDYLQFCQMLVNGGVLGKTRLLSPKTIDFMTRDHLDPDMGGIPLGEGDSKGLGFGLGFAVIKNAGQYGHIYSDGVYAWGGAASTIFWIDPAEELVVILMTQVMASADAFPIREQMQPLVYQAIID